MHSDRTASEDLALMDKHLSDRRKLRVERPVYWDHHRGGWRYVVDLVTEHLHSSDGVRFVSAVEDTLREGECITEPWVGFVHQVPRQNLEFPDLERLLELPTWKASAPHCRGLWVLSTHLARFLRASGVEIPINHVYYPVEFPAQGFSFQRWSRRGPRRVLFIGEFLRQYQAFYDLPASAMEKVLLRSPEFEPEALGLRQNDTVRVMDRVSVEEYDAMLTDSVVFMSLADAGANTTIVECIARATPILVNRVGGVAEYLGEDYPFYYSTLEEAARKLADPYLVARTTAYLERCDTRSRITASYFLRSIQNTAIYRSLPVPRSQRTDFEDVDVTVVICSYKRVDHMETLLERMATQNFQGTYAVLVWNNNFEVRDELQAICDRFQGRLAFKVVHSTENFYCMIRMAMPALARSDLVLICDDDVLPTTSYISGFVAKYAEHGPDAVICARGHVFEPHRLDEENPGVVWGTGKHMHFFDESHDDRKIHFAHADNFLIPQHLLRAALRYEMKPYDFALVDDYWLSFVLSHHLGIPIWKVRADHLFTFTKSADDPSVAMFHSRRVWEERINFYVHHMRAGWPSFDVEDTSENTEAP
jgi:glycosyltransferase involved in cell wall biosynthesis